MSKQENVETQKRMGEVAVDHMVSDGDNVSIAYLITGTHKGNFLGIPSAR